MQRIRVKAHPNVAVAKYWGKREATLNLPCTGSISVTLGGLQTTATLTRIPGPADEVLFGDRTAGGVEAERVSRFLGLVRGQARHPAAVRVHLESDFPVAAGIASSASTFAALAVAATNLLDVPMTTPDLSVLARRGSGSAARSILSGFVEWRAGESPDGTDSYAVQIAPPEHWDLAILVAVTDSGPKRVGSTAGMARSAGASPFFGAWLDSHERDLDEIRRAIAERDLTALGAAAEHNCLKMHAVALGSRPPLLYWRPATLAVIERVWQLREAGRSCYFTIDAGPQVKVLCPAGEAAEISAELGHVPGVERVLRAHPGAEPEILERE